MHLTRDQILAVDDTTPTLTEVDVPEWGGSVLVRVMSGRDRDRFEDRLSKEPGNNLRALLCSLCLCDGRGKRLFAEADVAALGDKSAPALHRVFDAAIKLNAIGKQDVEGLEKNSGAATSGDTPSGSPPDAGSPTSTASSTA